MNTYELFLILPGTLAETEVKPAVESVAKIVSESGGGAVEMQDLGKSRLAYPMRQIRYGYFHAGRFQAEPGAIPGLQAKLAVLTGVLRALVRLVSAATMKVDKVSVVSDVFSREAGEVKSEMLASPEAAAHRVDRIQRSEPVLPLETVKIETKAADVKLDDIDKKLDELLEREIAGV